MKEKEDKSEEEDDEVLDKTGLSICPRVNLSFYQRDIADNIQKFNGEHKFRTSEETKDELFE